MIAAIRAALIEAAADLWLGADDTDLAANSEYLRGQVELIAESTGTLTDDPDVLRSEIEHRVLARIAKETQR